MSDRIPLQYVEFVKSLPFPVTGNERPRRASRLQTTNPADKNALVSELWQLPNGWVSAPPLRYPPHWIDHVVEAAPAAPVAHAPSPIRPSGENAPRVVGNPPAETPAGGAVAGEEPAPDGAFLTPQKRRGRPPKAAGGGQ